MPRIMIVLHVCVFLNIIFVDKVLLRLFRPRSDLIGRGRAEAVIGHRPRRRFVQREMG